MADNSFADSKVIELCMAIIKDNLEKAVELVDYFNSHPTHDFKDGLNFYDLIDYKDTKTFKYVVTHLKTYPDIDSVNWNILVIMKIIEQYNSMIMSKDEIAKFVREQLDNEDIETYKLTSLVRLSNIIHDYDLLYRIKEIIDKSRGDE